ncbi:MAG: protoporphyrinogen oxidase [Acidobacteria bacterium]|nr:protoporphyrinogen oxidase [Acidobacteriota bacterium]
MNRTEVVVIGGGLAGLFAAIELAQRDVDVVVLEAAKDAGGVARSIVDSGYLLDAAVGSFVLPHPYLTPILSRLGVELVQADKCSRRRWVSHKQRLRVLPMGLKQLATSGLLGPVGKVRAVFEPLLGRGSTSDDESLSEFLSRRFGRSAGQTMSSLIASGVYAGDPELLSAASSFPRLYGLESESGSIVRAMLSARNNRPADLAPPSLHAPVGGMASVVDSCADVLGERLHTQTKVTKLERSEGQWTVESSKGSWTAEDVVVAVRPDQASGFLPKPVASTMSVARSAPVVVVGVGGRAADLPFPYGFGYLTMPGENLRTVGVIFESAMFPGRAPSGHRMAKVILGGSRNPYMVEWSDEQLAQIAVEELAWTLDQTLEASWLAVVRHRAGIPQYEIGHAARRAHTNRALEAYPGLRLIGWGYDGVAIADRAKEAVELADAITGSNTVV